jgi:hypothetical protein
LFVANRDKLRDEMRQYEESKDLWDQEQLALWEGSRKPYPEESPLEELIKA